MMGNYENRHLDILNRRAWLRTSAAGLAGLAASRTAGAGSLDDGPAAEKGTATRFQIACMTLPYARFPFQRALTGIQGAGFRYVAWATTHQEAAGPTPIVPPDAPADRAKELGKRCRDLGLE